MFQLEIERNSNFVINDCFRKARAAIKELFICLKAKKRVQVISSFNSIIGRCVADEVKEPIFKVGAVESFNFLVHLINYLKSKHYFTDN